MAERLLVEAINDCFHVELGRDDSVMVMGEDVGRAGGVFRATAGLRDKYGPDRCVDTPLAEAGILGTAVGLCMAGWKPVCEMQYDAFSYPCLDQLITHVGRYRWRTGGGMEFPVTIRMPYGGGVRAPELHDDSPEAYYAHTHGVKVAIPAGDRLMSTLDLTFEPEPVEVRRLEVITGVDRRRAWSDEAKARIIAETLRPGASVSAVARRYGLWPQQLFTWRRLARGHAAVSPAEEPVTFASVVVAPPAVPDASQAPTKRAPRRRPAPNSGGTRCVATPPSCGSGSRRRGCRPGACPGRYARDRSTSPAASRSAPLAS